MQYERWWNIKLTGLMSKQHFFLGYAGRYIRHPPIAQHRFVTVTDREVQFLKFGSPRVPRDSSTSPESRPTETPRNLSPDFNSSQRQLP